MERPVIPYENQLFVEMKRIYPTFWINLYIFYEIFLLIFKLEQDVMRWRKCKEKKAKNLKGL